MSVSRTVLYATFVASFAVLGLTGCVAPSQPIDIDQTSLSKTSPFVDTVPRPFHLNAGQFRPTPLGAPAMIPHAIDGYAVTPKSNPCAMCHAVASRIGTAPAAGSPTTMPASHWDDLQGTPRMNPSRYECLLCHAPQADVVPLVPTRE